MLAAFQQSFQDTAGMVNEPKDIYLATDTLQLPDSSAASLIGHFLESSNRMINAQPLTVNNMEWIGYLVLGLLSVIALLWYLFRERLISLFQFTEFTSRTRSTDTSSNSPGLLLNILLLINFVFTMTLFGYLGARQMYSITLTQWSLGRILTVILIVVISLFVLKMTLISLTGFLFNTRPASVFQRRLYFQVNNLLGILLLPVLFLLIFQPGWYLLIVGVILIFAAQILKWYGSFFNVISLPGISLFHIIVYLCTLEIVPILVIIKLLNNSLA
ncbi:MAG: DUF4271 domain-containing protein [bacterium]